MRESASIEFPCPTCGQPNSVGHAPDCSTAFPKTADTFSQDNVAEQEVETDPQLQQLNDLLDSPDFETQFLFTQTKGEADQKDAAVTEFRKAVDFQLKPLVEMEAAKSLNIPSIEEARKQGKKWGEALRAVQEVTLPQAQTSVSVGEARQAFEGILKKDFSGKIEKAEEDLKQAVEAKKQILGRLREEVKEPNREFAEALRTWGLSPNVKGEFGPDGKGFNAGIIHYFEYRASVEKNSRFRPEDELSAEGFINYTKNIKNFLDNPDPASNPGVQTARLLEDQNGQRRLFVLTKYHELVVAFQRPHEPMRIISIFPGQGLDRLSKAVEDEQNQNTKTKTRLNKLSGEVKELPIGG